MEYVTGSDPKPEIGIGEMEIDAAQALADMAVKGPDPQEKERRNERGEAKAPVGQEKEAQDQKTESGVCASTSRTSIPRRGKQNLTEAEREAKRLRRILANRESARQTILRRQALREELARKVAELSSENQHMKMEKEMAMQEFLSLKETNMQLKEQLAKLSMSKPDAIPRETKASSSTKFPWAQPSVQNYIGCNPSTSASGPSFGFSSYSSLDPSFDETPPPSSGTKRYEEKQLLPSVDETDVSCSLTLGLEMETRSKTPAVETCHEKGAPMVACSKEEEERHRVKAAEARRKRKEITRLKQMHRRA